MEEWDKLYKIAVFIYEHKKTVLFGVFIFVLLGATDYIPLPFELKETIQKIINEINVVMKKIGIKLKIG